MCIRACLKLLPEVSNVAVFDTAFHQTIPSKAHLYALPEKYYKKHGIRRYGFHGISHQYVAEEAARRLRKSLSGLKIITCHLGGGCSICAVDRGKSVDTSMGFTPAEGLVMMTRSGDLDPSIPLFLQKQERLSPQRVDEIINFESGIYGLCGCKDWLTLLKKVRMGNRKAKLAFDIFVYRLKKYIGAYYAVLGELNALVFTGAIGSSDAMTRRKVCARLPFLKGISVLAIKTNEGLLIARETVKRA
jgi:acetate kinase